MRGRAFRRHHKDRLRKRAYYLLHSLWFYNEEMASNLAIYKADNFKNCSCGMCTNPRRYGELTIQEKKHLED